jgi:hypothetical protein
MRSINNKNRKTYKQLNKLKALSWVRISATNKYAVP